MIRAGLNFGFGVAVMGVVCWGCSNNSSGGVVPDAQPACQPFRSVLGDPPYLEGWDGVDVSAAVTCGTEPYYCTIFQGDGEGTVPSGVSQDPADTTGCTLVGEVDSSNLPGTYGFIVVVHDGRGDTVDIPVFFQGEPCDTDHVALDPTDRPVRVEAGGSAYSWTLTVDDLDAPCDDVSCATCRWCAHLKFLALEPVTGIHYMIADDPLGPFHFTTDEFLVGDEVGSFYTAKLLLGADDKWVLLASRQFTPDGAFLGELSDPLSVRVGQAGDLSVDWSAQAQT